MVKGIVFGSIAGVIGMLIWAGIAYQFSYEFAWIAWGIGALVGVAVGVGFGERANAASGMVAVAITCLSIIGGKYVTVEMLMDHELGQVTTMLDEMFEDKNYLVSLAADEILTQRVMQGQLVETDGQVNPESEVFAERYPKAIWTQAHGQWQAMSESERESFSKQKRVLVEAQVNASVDAFRDEVSGQAFVESFSGFDFIFFGFAAYISFAIASGKSSDQ